VIIIAMRLQIRCCSDLPLNIATILPSSVPTGLSLPQLLNPHLGLGFSRVVNCMSHLANLDNMPWSQLEDVIAIFADMMSGQAFKCTVMTDTLRSTSSELP
jgi:hypothetical protein